MKVSLSAVKQYIDFELPAVDELVQKIGAQLGAVEEVVDLGKKYQGIVIVKVVKVEKHPDADKLIVCMIDDGGAVSGVERDKDGYVQIVSRALNEHDQPNVREGTLVAWIPPGKIVPRTYDSEQFVLEVREMRGVKSYGMLTSGYELAISDDHSGVLALDIDTKPGTELAEAVGIKDDHVIDIENKMFTHRPDCFGLLGVAREIAGILHKPFKSPDWYVPGPEFPPIEGEELKLVVKNELPELVPRFTAVAMSGVEIGPSPVWLQVALTKFGQKPVNNVVDLTNFYMMVTGQPLHAYDYDKVKTLSGSEPAIVIRKPKKGEKIKLLNGKTLEPRSEAVMIATDKQLIGIGGVMGGSETEVDKNTKNIILECANFDMYSIRRTAMEHGLFTDAVTRFTKGQSPLQCKAVSAKTAQSIQEIAAGKVASEFIDVVDCDTIDVASDGWNDKPVSITPQFINTRLGLDLAAGETIKLLENVEFGHDQDGDNITLYSPFWRTDIEIPEDIVEEVGRLYGYDHLPLTLPKRDLTPAPKDPLMETKSRIRTRLAKAGANEVLTYSFVHGDLLDKAGQDKGRAFQIANALSPDLQYYRLSLTPSLLDKVHSNIKAGYDEFALFEIGKAHLADQTDDMGLPREDELTAVVIAAADKLKRTGAAYYEAREYLTDLVPVKLTFKPVPEGMRKYDITKPFDMNRAAFIYADDVFLGIIGEFRGSVRKLFKLPGYCAGYELDTTALHDVLKTAGNYVALPRFPKVTQDITLKVPADLTYQELFDFVSDEAHKSRPKNSLAELEPRDIFQREEDKGHKQVTFHLQIASYDRTLTDSEVNKLLDQVAASAKAEFGAERV